jgi:sulfatase maturation enzyme AslB (radical SAM superfamily)
MELSSLTIILTDQCNFDCAYCYEKKSRRRLDPAVLARAVRFFGPFLAGECSIDFYGGEPLLAFAEIRKTVEHIGRISKKQGIRADYSITTNGSLLNDDILDFLNDYQFTVLLSFDGLAQDISRKKGSFDFLMAVIPRILGRPRISLETNSVFTSDTIQYLSASIKLINQLGIRKFNVSLGHRQPWTPASLLREKKELARVRNYFRSLYKNASEVPWTDWVESSQRAIYSCAAGRGKMALAADGTLWGCFLFPQFFSRSKKGAEAKKYCFGDVDGYIKNYRTIYPRIMENYAALRMDNFSTPDGPCAMCDELGECWICPLAAALVSRKIGRIPALICGGARMWRKEKRRLRAQFAKPN